MSKLVGTVFKLVQGDKKKERQKLRNGTKKPRGTRRDRSLQYADSFIFVPGEITNRVSEDDTTTTTTVLPGRLRANTCADELVSSPSINISAVEAGKNIGKSIKSRISQEVVDEFSHRRNRSSQEMSFLGNPDTLSPPTPPPHKSTISLDIVCPSGERYHHLRPYSLNSLGHEYTTPLDCIRPTASWYQATDSDLESLREGNFC